MLTTELHSSLASKEVLGSAAVGAVTFPTVLAFAQTAVFKPLKITVGSKLIAPVFGGISVSFAGFAASLSAIKACSLIQGSVGDRTNGEADSRTILLSAPELIISTVSSAVIFRALGGRFSSVLPSHLFHPGAFARERIPAFRGFQFATTGEKNIIRDYGRRYGCHTCGRKRVSGFASDHQPPSHLLRQSNSSNGGNNGGLIRQFFYPQCFDCSSLQGGILNNGNLSKAIITHPFSLRLYHAFLPVPFLVAYLKSRLQEGTMSSPAKRTTSSGDRLKDVKSTSVVSQDKADKGTQTDKGSAVVASSSKSTLRTLIQDSDISELVSNFPLLIVWMRAVQFLDSFKNPGDAFHIMLWAFVIVAAWGTV